MGFVPVGLEIDECGSQSWKATKNKQKLYSERVEGFRVNIFLV